MAVGKHLVWPAAQVEVGVVGHLVLVDALGHVKAKGGHGAQHRGVGPQSG